MTRDIQTQVACRCNCYSPPRTKKKRYRTLYENWSYLSVAIIKPEAQPNKRRFACYRLSRDDNILAHQPREATAKAATRGNASNREKETEREAVRNKSERREVR